MGYDKENRIETTYLPVTYPIPIYDYCAPLIEIFKYMQLSDEQILKILYYNN